MVKISADQPLNRFAEKVAERTGLPQQEVTHVLTAAMVVACEESETPEQDMIAELARQVESESGVK